MYLLVCDDSFDVITQYLREEATLHHEELLVITIRQLLRDIEIFDEIKDGQVSISWRLSNGRIIRNSADTILINRVKSLDSELFHDFYPDDRDFACAEFYSYLMFALSSFKRATAIPSSGGLSGAILPLFRQWLIVRESFSDINVPQDYLGPLKHCPFDLDKQDHVFSQPYNFYKWKNEAFETQEDPVFCFQKPPGRPLLFCILGNKAEPLSDCPQDSQFGAIAVAIAQKFGYLFAEILLFEREGELCFGMCSPILQSSINVKNLGRKLWACLREWCERDELKVFEVRARPLEMPFSDNIQELAVALLGVNVDFTYSTMRNWGEASPHMRAFALEDFGQTWDFLYSQGCFLIRDEKGQLLRPNSVYYRESAIKENHILHRPIQWLNLILPSSHLALIGNPERAFYNTSKPLQILRTQQLLQSQSGLQFPQTFIVKGRPELLQELPLDQANLIVKSISSLRSVVAEGKNFQTWDPRGLNHIPTQFQQLIKGDDLRVHVCFDQVVSKVISDKNYIDYRYATVRSSFEDEQLPQPLIESCRRIAQLEDNSLVGIDFLYDGLTYFFLETNPMPGWAWYYNPKTCEVNPIAEALIDGLCP